MNTNIRKDNKVSAHTNNNVAVIGTVMGVSGDQITIQTPTGVEHSVLKVNATKLSAAEFKLALLEATQPTVEVKTETPVDVKAEVKKEVAKVNKKAEAKAIFMATSDQKRKVVISRFMNEVGLSAAGASTYYQNFKSGTWSTI